MAKKNGAPTKSEVVAQICKDTDLSRKQVAAVFESLNGIIKKSLRGAGMFTMPGLLAESELVLWVSVVASTLVQGLLVVPAFLRPRPGE